MKHCRLCHHETFISSGESSTKQMQLQVGNALMLQARCPGQDCGHRFHEGTQSRQEVVVHSSLARDGVCKVDEPHAHSQIATGHDGGPLVDYQEAGTHECEEALHLKTPSSSLNLPCLSPSGKEKRNGITLVSTRKREGEMK